MSQCDNTCRGCIFASITSANGVLCDYILVTGNMRRCPAGAGCERRIAGHRRKSIDSLIYRGKPEQTAEPTPEQLAALAAERKDRKKEWRRDWYAANRESINAKRREWRRKRKEQADDGEDPGHDLRKQNNLV